MSSALGHMSVDKCNFHSFTDMAMNGKSIDL